VEVDLDRSFVNRPTACRRNVCTCSTLMTFRAATTVLDARLASLQADERDPINRYPQTLCYGTFASRVFISFSKPMITTATAKNIEITR